MAARSNTARLQVGSAAWVADERASAAQLAELEVEEFTFSARNELEWLNEHMREIFDENELYVQAQAHLKGKVLTGTRNVAEMFKTPGKLRGKTPRTIRRNPLEMRAPLTDIFSASPRNAPATPQTKVHIERPASNFKIAKDVASSPASVATKAASTSPEKPSSPVRKPAPSRAALPQSFQDSGYYTQSQSQSQATQEATQRNSPSLSPEPASPEAQQQNVEDNYTEDERPRTADTVETVETHMTDDQDMQAQLEAEASQIHDSPAPTPARESVKNISSPVNWTPGTAHTLKQASPYKDSPFISPYQSMEVDEKEEAPKSEQKPNDVFDEAGTPSDGSSPVRQVIRKSSLSFASLPQREPLTVKKSIGQRTSRGSHFDQSRSSYFGKRDGKSVGGQRAQEAQDDRDEMELDDAESSAKRSSKTYTQRLQDQINLLGQVKTTQSRLSKSITNLAAASAAQPSYPTLPLEEEHIPSSPMRTVHTERTERSFAAPGAYPEEEDSWIGGPPSAAIPINNALSPRQHLVKSYSVDVMEDIRGKGSIGGREFKVPRREPRQPSPMVEKPISAVLNHARQLGHLKSQSTTSFHSPQRKEEIRGFETLKKTISVENPHRDGHDWQYQYSPSKSPTHSLRGSPLKAAKDKLSSILKTSKGLFASSAAVSAEAKMAASNSPTASRNVSREEQALRAAQNEERPTTSLYPALSNPFENQSRIPDSPSKKNSIRKLKEKEAKEAKKKARKARIMAEQLTKLDKERNKEAEKARVFSQQERERVAAMERKVAAQREVQKQEEERRAAQTREEERREAERREERRLEEERAAEEDEQRRVASEREAERKAASTPSIPRPTRTSPRKTKAQLEAESRAAAAKRTDCMDVDDDTQSMPPPPSTIGRSQIARPKSAAANRLQRPTSKQAAPAARGAPVVIRVNTGSRPFQPSTAALSASLGDSLPPAPPVNPAPPPVRAGRPATKAIVPKASNESLKGNNTGRLKALESAAKKREQEEREAREKRDAKLAMSKQLEAKRNAQKDEERKRELERAKMTRPPPPPARPNPNAEREKPLPGPPANHRINQELNRPLQDRNEGYQSTKAPPKRPLGGEENQRPGMPRNGPSYQQQSEAKRRKTEDEYDFDPPSPPRGAAAPPIRQSSIRKQVSQTLRAPSHPPRTAPVHLSDLSKDAPMKSLFPQGYAAAQGPDAMRHAPNAIPSHMQQKPTRPMENKPPHGFGIGNPGPSHKTPARMGPAAGGKSTGKRAGHKDSPKYQNGDSIDLPEINTDSEDSGSDAGADFAVPEWAESPNLAAGIIAQEGRDPMTVFGPPGELKMEEVFRNKERWGRFRQRTSSANWSGQDRLTEEEVRRDLEMRERLRREGGWSYGMS